MNNDIIKKHLIEDGAYFDCNFEKSEKFNKNSIEAIFFDGIRYRQQKTKYFAYIGFPSKKNDRYQKFPGVVLVHGGGGTAYVEWVKHWNAKGYAAIAVDLEGHIPIAIQNPPRDNQFWERHDWSGPCRKGIFDDCDLPLEEQWPYHAIFGILRAHRILAGFDFVNSKQIGIHGISWGGILTCITLSLDHDFSFGISVYGCGYLYESKGLFGTYDYNEKKLFWDPKQYLSNINTPMLWINGDSDSHFSLDIFCKSFSAVKNSFLTIHPSMSHSHQHGWEPEEIYAFADGIISNKKVFCRVENFNWNSCDERCINIYTKPVKKISQIDVYTTNMPINYENDRKKIKSKWILHTMNVVEDQKYYNIILPLDTNIFYVNISDEEGLVSSLPIIETI